MTRRVLQGWRLAAAIAIVGGSVASAQNLYFGSIPFYPGAPKGLLFTSDLNGGGLTNVMPSPPTYIAGVAADGGHGTVFWKDHLTNPSNPHATLYAMDIATGSHSLIWTGSQVGNSYGVAVDEVSQRVFWTAGQTIHSANYDGTGLTTVFTGWYPTELEVDPAAGKLFWTESTSTGAYEVRSANLNGSGLQTLYTAAAGHFSGITVDPATSTIFFSDRAAALIQSLPYAGGTPTTLQSGLAHIAGLDFEPTTNRLYAVNKGTATVSWMLASGGPMTTVFTGSGNQLGEMWDISVVVPEPGTLLLFGLGALAAVRRR